MSTKEHTRLEETKAGTSRWKFWGPYLSERQWGTVREDYSSDGNAWEYFPHDQARSRAYRWGEDGLAGISDEKQRLCFALALWNGKDPIIKERLFGLTNAEGNHGEDVKEYYFYLDSTPTHSYMKYLYKYPQNAFPYDELVRTNRQRSRYEPEYELMDTGVFDDDRYFDVIVEYCKEGPDDILIRMTVSNRGNKDAVLHLLPTLWFRNTWFRNESDQPRPQLRRVQNASGHTMVEADHSELGKYYLYADGAVPLLFTENETNVNRLYTLKNYSPFVKDGVNEYLVKGDASTVNPEQHGTKVSVHFALNVKGRKSTTVNLRLSSQSPEVLSEPFGERFKKLFVQRIAEADAFYDAVSPDSFSADEALVFRQALAGMLWSKQYYYFDLQKWLAEHDADPFSNRKHGIRNREWFHMLNDDIISMPDKWEYPWYAAWDLAFHTYALSLVDFDFAKQQINLMLSELYLHPNGQIPAYEWNFGDVNPPVHASIAYMLYAIEKERTGTGDVAFLKSAFSKLALNFTWWVNRKDRYGKNVYEGGFLGMDNIGVFDRSAPLPTGGFLEQADGTAWMAYYAQNMLEISLELASFDSHYEDMALKFIEHFIWISSAMDRIGDNRDEMWDDQDGFFYDVLRYPDGGAEKLKIRSMVGLLPLCATTVIEKSVQEKFPGLMEKARSRVARLPHLKVTNKNIATPGVQDRLLLSLVDEDKLRHILRRLLDETEFLSDYGIRSLSKAHEKVPFKFSVNSHEYRVDYVPGDSNSSLFGGNSNWRGPIWMPVNLLIVRALRQFFLYFGDNLQVECPTGSGNMMNLYQVSEEISNRLTRIFVRNKHGKRAVYGTCDKFQTDPHWKDLVLFFEYFNGDTGQGIGASHQTGWSGLVARFLHTYDVLDEKAFMKGGAKAVAREG